MDVHLREGVKLNPPRGSAWRSVSRRRATGAALRARAALVAYSFLFCVGLTRTGASAEPPQAAPRVLADFPLGKGDSVWVVRATIRYNEYQMLIDTGCGATLFDITHRDALGKVIGVVNINRANGMAPVKGVERRQAPVLEIGELKVRPRAGVVCTDLGTLTKRAGTKIDGVLGTDLLRQLVLNVDPDEGRIRFYSAPGPTAGTRVPVFWDNSPGLNGNPLVEVAFGDGVRRRFVIDAGMYAGLAPLTGELNARMYEELISDGTALSLPVASSYTTYTFGGPQVVDKWAKVSRMSLSAHAHGGLIFSCGPGPSCLGRGYLSRFCITFDFGHDTIYLRPSKQYQRADFYDLSGMRFVKQNHVAAVSVVFKEGPAAAAGLAPGDSITAIDAQKVRELSDAAIHEFFLKDGQHSIEFRRGDMLNRAVLVIGSKADASPATNSPSREK